MGPAVLRVWVWWQSPHRLSPAEILLTRFEQHRLGPWPSQAPDGSRMLEIHLERTNADRMSALDVVGEWRSLMLRRARDVDDEFSTINVREDGDVILLIARPGSRAWKDMMVVLIQRLGLGAREGFAYLVVDRVSGRSRRGPWTA